MEINVMILDRTLKEHDSKPDFKFQFFEFDSLYNIFDEPKYFQEQIDI